MLKIRDGIDLKELEKYGFQEFNDYYARCYTTSDIETYVYKDTLKIIDVDTDYKYLEMKDLGESKRVNDLIKAYLVEKVSDSNED